MKPRIQLELVGRLAREPGGSVGYMMLLNKLVILVNDDRLQVVDSADPSAPKVVGTYRSRAALGSVAIACDHAYVVEKEAQMRVLDVSDPAQPRRAGLLRLSDEIQRLAAVDDYVYATTTDSLRVLSISDPTLPVEVGVCGGMELAGRVTVAGRRAYVAADFNGMIIIDVSKPAQPRRIGSFEGPGNVTKIAVVEPYAFLADYTGGLHIVDIKNPRTPREIGQFGDFIVGDVAVVNDYALLAAGSLEVVDVSKPNRPKSAAQFSSADCDTAWSVAAAGDVVYTISDAGLFIFRLRTLAT